MVPGLSSGGKIKFEVAGNCFLVLGDHLEGVCDDAVAIGVHPVALAEGVIALLAFLGTNLLRTDLGFALKGGCMRPVESMVAVLIFSLLCPCWLWVLVLCWDDATSDHPLVLPSRQVVGGSG